MVLKLLEPTAGTVTYDGKECTAASIESKKLTFTCEGKTYEASFVNDVLTITEKA